PEAPFPAIASRASRRPPAGSDPTHRQTLPLGGVCVNRTSRVCSSLLAGSIRTPPAFGGRQRIRGVSGAQYGAAGAWQGSACERDAPAGVRVRSALQSYASGLE